MTASPRIRLASVVIGCTLASPPTRTLLEANMATHMLVQIPLLLALGLLLPHWLSLGARTRLLRASGGPIAAVTIATFVISYWMLPRALDAALTHPSFEALKFLSLPVLAGLPLALGWPDLGVLGRGVFLSNTASMLAVVGWLYMEAPVRLCNQYLVDDQTQAGHWMVGFALAVLAWWMSSLFKGHTR